MDDPAIVAAMAIRDPAGLDFAYRRYADRLYAYARSLTGDSHVAADVVQDTFLLASQHVKQLRDPSRLGPWLYAIARHEGLRQIRNRAKHAPLEVAPEVAADSVDLTRALHAAQVAEMVRAAMNGLSKADHEIAELAIRHQLSAADIASVLDVPVNNVHARLSRAREQLAVALGALLVARQPNPECPELAELLQGWDGQLNPLLRKRLHRHIESCSTCAEVRRQKANPAALLSVYAGLPLLTAPALRRASADAAPDALAWRADTGFPRAKRGTRTALVAGAVVLVLLLSGAVAFGRGPEPRPMRTPTVVTLSPIVLTEAPSVAPTAPPSKASPAPPPAPLSFSASASATCSTSPNVIFTVTVTANVELATAKLIVVGPIGTHDMSIYGKNAQKTVTGAASTEIMWHVEVRDWSGRSVVGPSRTTDSPCF